MFVYSNNFSNAESKSNLKIINIFKFDSTLKDSTLLCQKILQNDSIIYQKGDFNMNLPFQSDCIDNYTIELAKGKKVLETFDSLICELGGKTAWNKYYLRYDNNSNNKQKRPVQIVHYSANLEYYDKFGEPQNYKFPRYFFRETMFFEYSPNLITQITKNSNGQIIEKIVKKFDNFSRLIYEELFYFDQRYKVYYQYE